MKTLIIAEAGVNHNGELEKALALIDAAADAAADVVKFQTFKADKLVSKDAQKADYQINNSKDNDNSQYKMLKKLEIPLDWYPKLITHCEKRNITFLSTGFDEESIDFLESLNPPFYKIPSGEITNKPYLEYIAGKGRPIILSTGMADINEIMEAILVLEKKGINKNDITILHCNTEYPTPMEDVNLKAMFHIQNTLGVKVGYSDHTLGIEVPIAAVALGACVIEKHFTLDRNMPGPDHAASLEPHELKAMVTAIRNIEKAITGTGIKQPSKSELKNKFLGRKSIIAIKPIKKGEVFTKENIGIKRPGTGISPMKWYDVLGEIAKKEYKFDDLIDM